MAKRRRLSPSHDHFELVADPWHEDAFAGIPEVLEASTEGRGRIITLEGDVGTGMIKSGARRQVWYSVDWCGNLIQEWGEDTPPGRASAQLSTRR